jgi:hypothetical protein
MAQVIQANELTLSQVEDQFNPIPNPEQPTFGLVTNGSNFIFIKLLGRELPQYAFSTEFCLFRPENELYPVLKVFAAVCCVGDKVAIALSILFLAQGLKQF